MFAFDITFKKNLDIMQRLQKMREKIKLAGTHVSKVEF